MVCKKNIFVSLLLLLNSLFVYPNKFKFTPEITLEGYAEAAIARWSPQSLNIKGKSTYYIATASGMGIKIWDDKGHFLEQIFGAHKEKILDLGWHGTLPCFATASQDSSIKVWHMDINPLTKLLETQCKLKLEGHTKPVTSICWSKNFFQDCILYSASLDGTIRIWDTTTGARKIMQGDLKPITAIALDSTERYLVSGHNDGNVYLWDLNRNEFKARFVYHSSPITGLCWLDGTKFASCAGDKTITICDATSGKVVKELTNNSSKINTICLLDDIPIHSAYEKMYTNEKKSLLASGNNNGTITIWDYTTGGEMATIPCHDAQISTISQDPRPSHSHWILTAGYDNVAKIWILPIEIFPKRNNEVLWFLK